MQFIPNISPKLTSEPYVSYHDILIVFDYLGKACRFNKETGLEIDDCGHSDPWVEWLNSEDAKEYFEKIDSYNK